MKKLFACLGLIGLLLTAPGAASAAADWPQKPVTFIVPFAAGGNTDVLFRILAPHLEKELGVPCLVKNVSGANGTIGAAELAAAKPDGYTIGFMSNGAMSSQPHLRKLPYSNDSWEYICLMYDNPVAVMVSQSSPFKTWLEFVEAAKAAPDKYIYSSTGPGSIPHLTMLALCKAFDIKVRHMAERSGAEAMKSLAAGTISLFADSATYVIRFENRGLLTVAPERNKDLPGVPSTTDVGKPDLRYTVWNGVYAPKGTPKPILDKLAAVLKRLSAKPEIIEAAARSGSVVHFLEGREFIDFHNSEYEKIGRLIKETGMKTQ